LNARHIAIGCKGTNAHGKKLLKFLNSSSNIILNDPSTPTFTHTAIPCSDALDYALATPKASRLITNCVVGKDIGSDHLPLEISFKDKDNIQLKGDTNVNTQPPLNVAKTNWEQFAKNIKDAIVNNNILWPLPTIASSEDLDSFTAEISTLIKNEIETNTPRHRPADKERPRLPPLALALINSRRLLKKEHAQHPTDENRTKINELNKAIKRIIKTTKKNMEFERAKILKQGPRDPRFWYTVKNLLYPRSSQIHPILVDGHFVEDPHEKLDIFKQLFSKVLIDNDDDPPNTHVQCYVNNRAETLSEKHEPNAQGTELLKEITLGEMTAAVRKTKNKKAPGPDLITYEHIKHLPPEAVSIILTIFNAAIKLHHFPNKFKECLVTLIPKPGKDPTSPLAYRPITLAPCISKIFERIINERLLQFALKHQILKTHQTAFLPTKGTDDNIIRALQAIVNNFNDNKYTLLITTDIEKAFDKAWHAGILDNLSTHVPTNYLLLIKSFLKNRQLKFKLEGAISDWHLIPTRGMPQGSPLSPLLFNIIMSTAPAPNTHNVQTYNYADDVFLTSAAITPNLAWRQIKEHLSNFITWCNNNKLTIQPAKTQAIFFTRRRSIPPSNFPTMIINNTTITRSNTVKVLGLTLDTHLTLTKHITNIANKSAPIVQNIRQLMTNNTIIPSYVAILLYKTLIRTKITYGAPALNLIKPTSWRPLKSLENRALRAAFRTGIRTPVKTMIEKARINQIDQHYQLTAAKTLFRLLENKNKEIIKTMFSTRGMYRPPDVLQRAYTVPPLDGTYNKMPLIERNKAKKGIEKTLYDET
jgi:hypothetical protein